MAESFIHHLPLPGQPSLIRIDGDSAFITIGRGLEAIVDVGDVPLISQDRWLAIITHTGHVYAYRRTKVRPVELMHRVILGTPKGLLTDHVDGDGLNNRRCNIRVATPSQNNANRMVERRNRLGMKGVYQKTEGGKPVGRYHAEIQVKGRSFRLGAYDTAAEANAAYRGAALVLHGDFARS